MHYGLGSATALWSGYERGILPYWIFTTARAGDSMAAKLVDSGTRSQRGISSI